MSKWSFEEYLNDQVEEIKDLNKKVYTSRKILDTNKFCHEALRACDIPISYLIPKIKRTEMTIQE
ncbi:hypothetical protein [Clostridium sp. JS66]|uniref:hypothetical protein n=1 Tax=Clostridium sp. JS66 TaxID=3064705 RepID=UPI00298E49E1|nr:hypothetical protein [Clostridium sp. JS66]WPC42382.1 hypothetical protein Q6H37_02655 [Clostridium sp. JS66]